MSSYLLLISLKLSKIWVNYLFLFAPLCLPFFTLINSYYSIIQSLSNRPLEILHTHLVSKYCFIVLLVNRLETFDKGFRLLFLVEKIFLVGWFVDWLLYNYKHINKELCLLTQANPNYCPPWSQLNGAIERP